MADFTSTLITGIVASIVSVLAFLALTIVLALYWSSIARRLAPNRFKEPVSEKQQWPASRESIETTLSSRTPSSKSSPRSSGIPLSRGSAAAPVFPKPILKRDRSPASLYDESEPGTAI
jgi:predicted lipid-binding transport protein (Tim44 family)